MKKIIQKAGYLIILLIGFGLCMLPQVGLLLQLKNKNELMQYFGFLLTIIIYILAIWLILKLLQKVTGTKIFKRHSGSFFKKYLAGMGMLLFSEYILGILNFLFNGENQTENNAAIMQLFSQQNSVKLTMVLMVVVFAPICEELFFRALVINTIKLKFFNINWAAVLISGILFGLLHSSDTIISALMYVTMGVILGAIYVKYDNIKLNIAIHTTNNLIALIPILMMIW
ncbi:CPBP family intramembrane glutamic endopeptidase [Liquorilactobacillus mali]|uniref:Metal-dependent membrane protease n=1 Tax=Liquorilactobacillus mali TaxID=1618 RepID=A0A0R2G0S2_9LACO|nr:CPBP family intramembrane glutamic endopeptidase [Liquorilactobacillus mali]KRN34371.1 metal-dependent membrane protease [Liquorilactobacillus mali]